MPSNAKLKPKTMEMGNSRRTWYNSVGTMPKGSATND